MRHDMAANYYRLSTFQYPRTIRQQMTLLLEELYRLRKYEAETNIRTQSTEFFLAHDVALLNHLQNQITTLSTVQRKLSVEREYHRRAVQELQFTAQNQFHRLTHAQITLNQHIAQGNLFRHVDYLFSQARLSLASPSTTPHEYHLIENISSILEEILLVTQQSPLPAVFNEMIETIQYHLQQINTKNRRVSLTKDSFIGEEYLPWFTLADSLGRMHQFVALLIKKQETALTFWFNKIHRYESTLRLTQQQQSYHQFLHHQRIHTLDRDAYFLERMCVVRAILIERQASYLGIIKKKRATRNAIIEQLEKAQCECVALIEKIDPLLPSAQLFKTLFDSMTPISIQEIVVTQLGPEDAGEIKKFDPDEERSSILSRIIKTMVDLASTALHHHLQFCHGKQLKTECKNTITRLTTDEFLFYPHFMLTTEEYQQILTHVTQYVQSLPENIHLLFGTLPIEGPDSRLFNTLLHITSGKNFTLHHCSKAYPWADDPSLSSSLASLESSEGVKNVIHSPKMAEIATFHTELTFSHGSIVDTVTAGGARLRTNVEICYDCMHFHGENNLRASIDQTHHEFIPSQYSKIISSRTVVMPYSINDTDTILQADAKHPGIWRKHPLTPLFNFIKPVIEKTRVFPFGPLCGIKIYPVYQAMPVSSPFYKMTRLHNMTLFMKSLVKGVDNGAESSVKSESERCLVNAAAKLGKP